MKECPRNAAFLALSTDPRVSFSTDPKVSANVRLAIIFNRPSQAFAVGFSLKELKCVSCLKIAIVTKEGKHPRDNHHCSFLLHYEDIFEKSETIYVFLAVLRSVKPHEKRLFNIHCKSAIFYCLDVVSCKSVNCRQVYTLAGLSA